MTARSGQQEMMGQLSYEDIKPKSAEWKEEKTAHVLNVRLPGFVREQIKVTYDENSRSFNVQGERPLGNNRFGRLNADFTIPDNCKIKDMQGKFQDEMLTITIPKGYISPLFAPKETTRTARSPPEKAPGITEKPPMISEPPRVPPQIPPPVHASSSSTEQPEIQSDYEKWKSAKREPNEKSLHPEAAERPSEKVPDRGKEMLEKEMKRSHDTDVAGFAGKDMARPKKSDKSKAGESESLVDDAKKKKRDGKVGEAEEQLIVNVGVAALVLVALGAYVGYHFAGPSSAKD